jgi:hypothetical protein|tara:strand:+ start:61 stop:363 length:303 start_codon:yes stop_codon:yes gene_type:complete
MGERPKEKKMQPGGKAYEEGFKVASKNKGYIKGMIPNLLTSSGRKELLSEFKARGGLGTINPVVTKKQKEINSQFIKGLKEGAKFYASKKKDIKKTKKKK